MEPLSNIRSGHRNTMPKPKGFSGDPLTLIGAYVKLSFSDLDGRVEHMWITVKEVNAESRTISGLLNNDPVLCKELKDGDLIENRRIDEIEQIEFDE
jgi:hypothetical protein